MDYGINCLRPPKKTQKKQNQGISTLCREDRCKDSPDPCFVKKKKNNLNSNSKDNKASIGHCYEREP